MPSIVYDKSNRPLKKIHDPDGIKATETWEYHDEERLVIYTDTNQSTHKTYHDKLGRIIKEINGLEQEITSTWDELSRLTKRTDSLQQSTILTYDDDNRTIISTLASSTSIIKKNAFNEIESELNADGELKQKKYDVDGQINTEIDADSHARIYSYNNAGWLIEIKNPLNKVQYKHNKSGQVEEQIELGLNNEVHASIFKRDAQGREIMRIDANQISTKTFDRRGLETDKIIDPDGIGIRTHYEYDGLGKVVLEIKESNDYPQQFITQFERDPLSRVTNKIIAPGQINLSTQTIYNALGNYIITVDPNNHPSYACFDVANNQRYAIDALGGVIGKKYNGNGQCIEERHYSIPLNLNTIDDFSWAFIESLLCTSDQDKVMSYAFNAEGYCIASLNEHRQFTQYTHNAQGKLIHEISYATPINRTEFMVKTPPSTPEDRQSAWFYDGRGNERFRINGEGAVHEQTWNEEGWLIDSCYARSILSCHIFKLLPSNLVRSKNQFVLNSKVI
ncbi:RHS repeat domain-containing protein [Legionella sp. km772]|uniref:RHS repeat domain-containing protein n=1 Tax=Legionella sp. km772 TaxID=2498111 RepID=UPI0013158B50|nr:hypothetical protein [Legionella sp. km772]